MQLAVDTIARTQEQLSVLDPELLYAIVENTSEFYDTNEALLGSLGSFGILPVIAEEVSSGFRDFEDILADLRNTRANLIEAFDFGVTHMCLAIKLAARHSPNSDDTPAQHPERVEAGLKLLETVPATTDIVKVYCTGPSSGNPLLDDEAVEHIVHQYEDGIVYIIPALGDLAITKLNDLGEADADFVKNVATMGATVTLGAVNYVFTTLTFNFGREAMESRRSS